MIDLHSHILPGIDDGAADHEGSVEIAREAVADGIRTLVATPHVNSRYDYDLAEIPRLADELRGLLAQHEIPLTLATGAEVALSRLGGLCDRTLRGLCLGTGSALLVEAPYAPFDARIEEPLLDLQRRGFHPVLAHPERCPLFQRDIGRLKRLVNQGVLCSVNSGSMTGVFGPLVRRFTLRLLAAGLVHDVASDAHDHILRAPRLSVGFEVAETDLEGIFDQRHWYTVAAPSAILAGNPLPARPKPPRLYPRWWPRLRRRGPHG